MSLQWLLLKDYRNMARPPTNLLNPLRLLPCTITGFLFFSCSKFSISRLRRCTTATASTNMRVLQKTPSAASLFLFHTFSTPFDYKTPFRSISKGVLSHQKLEQANHLNTSSAVRCWTVLNPSLHVTFPAEMPYIQRPSDPQPPQNSIGLSWTHLTPAKLLQ